MTRESRGDGWWNGLTFFLVALETAQLGAGDERCASGVTPVGWEGAQLSTRWVWWSRASGLWMGGPGVTQHRTRWMGGDHSGGPGHWALYPRDETGVMDGRQAQGIAPAEKWWHVL